MQARFFLLRHLLYLSIDYQLNELDFLRGGIATALEAARRAFDSVAFASALIRDHPSDAVRATVAVCNGPIHVIEHQPQPFTGIFEPGCVDVNVPFLNHYSLLSVACFVFVTIGRPQQRHTRASFAASNVVLIMSVS